MDDSDCPKLSDSPMNYYYDEVIFWGNTLTTFSILFNGDVGTRKARSLSIAGSVFA